MILDDESTDGVWGSAAPACMSRMHNVWYVVRGDAGATNVGTGHWNRTAWRARVLVLMRGIPKNASLFVPTP